jgi:hypothetical protein
MPGTSSDVGSWDPNAAPVILDEKLLERLAGLDLTAPMLGLEPAEVPGLAPLMKKPKAEWQLVLGGRSSDDLIGLVRFFALAESQFAGWEAGDASPVIPIAAELRRRGDYPESLTPWLKANSSNRFLPWGSLLDRL